MLELDVTPLCCCEDLVGLDEAGEVLLQVCAAYSCFPVTAFSILCLVEYFAAVFGWHTVDDGLFVIWECFLVSGRYQDAAACTRVVVQRIAVISVHELELDASFLVEALGLFVSWL